MFIPPKCFLCVSSSNTLTNISSYVYGILDTVFWESLADLANHPRFAKLKPSKLVRTINIIYWLICLILQTFFHQMFEKSQFAKLSRYTVIVTCK